MQARFFKRSISRILLIAGVAASMVACKKDKDNNPGGGNGSGSKIASFSDGETYAKFEYNADGTVKVLTSRTEADGGDENKFNVTYDAQKRISKLESDWQKMEVEYTNNVMSRANLFMSGTQIGYTDYQYTNGNLSKVTVHLGESGTFIPLIEYTYTYNAQGNLAETITKMAGEDEQLEYSGSIKYEYDSKTNPLYEHRQLMALLMLNVTKNNVTVENHLDANQQPEDKFQYTYTYNAKGLPEKAVVKQGLPGGEQTQSEVTYTYK